MKTRLLKSILTIMAIAMVGIMSSSCSKEDTVEKEEQGPDWTKVELAGTVWNIEAYSSKYSENGSIWTMGGENDLIQMVKQGKAHLEFLKSGHVNIVEDTQIFSDWTWDPKSSWLTIGWDTGYENEAKVEFKLSDNKKFVTMTWDSDVHGGGPYILIKATIEADKILK